MTIKEVTIKNGDGEVTHWGSEEHKENIKQSLVSKILDAGSMSNAPSPPGKSQIWKDLKDKMLDGEFSMPTDKNKKIDAAISAFEDGLVKDNPMHYQKTISYEVWDDDTKFISYSGLYAVGSWHEIDGTVFKVVDIQKNIATQNYEVHFVEAVPKPPLPTITTTSGDPVIVSGDHVKIESITDVVEEKGHFNDAGVWVKDPALSQLTEREKLFKELTNGVTS